MEESSIASADASRPKLPRVAITFCTQCKWMLRAAYFGQELLSTFGTSIGEVALIPATGGIFQVHLTFVHPLSGEQHTLLLWDRKAEGGFPETKILKQRLRNQIEPEKRLGHSDTPANKVAAKVGIVSDQTAVSSSATTETGHAAKASEPCEDCG